MYFNTSSVLGPRSIDRGRSEEKRKESIAMATQNPVADNGSFREEMLKILLGAADSVKARKCQAYSYTEHLIMGVERVISESTTGRAFI